MKYLALIILATIIYCESDGQTIKQTGSHNTQKIRITNPKNVNINTSKQNDIDINISTKNLQIGTYIASLTIAEPIKHPARQIDSTDILRILKTMSKNKPLRIIASSMTKESEQFGWQLYNAVKYFGYNATIGMSNNISGQRDLSQDRFELDPDNPNNQTIWVYPL